MSETQIKNAIENLTPEIKNLTETLKIISKSSNKNQKWLIFWTIIMALAVLSQAILIGIQIFGK